MGAEGAEGGGTSGVVGRAGDEGVGFHVTDFGAVRMMQMGVGEKVQWLIVASLTKHVQIPTSACFKDNGFKM
jgi:hypothetical protein